MANKRSDKNKKLNITQLFSSWILVASFLFLINFTNYSPTFALSLMCLFTFVNGILFMPIIHYSIIFIMYLIEFGALYLVIQKNKKIKRSLFNEKDLTITSLLFLLYTLYLYLSETSFQEVYFKKIPEEYSGTTLYEFYIEPYFS